MFYIVNVGLNASNPCCTVKSLFLSLPLILTRCQISPVRQEEEKEYEEEDTLVLGGCSLYISSFNAVEGFHSNILVFVRPQKCTVSPESV